MLGNGVRSTADGGTPHPFPAPVSSSAVDTLLRAGARPAIPARYAREQADTLNRFLFGPREPRSTSAGASVIEQFAWVALGAELELVLWLGGQEVGGRVRRRLGQCPPAVVFGLGDEFAVEEAVEDA